VKDNEGHRPLYSATVEALEALMFPEKERECLFSRYNNVTAYFTFSISTCNFKISIEIMTWDICLNANCVED
jgi:hypothetical protein